MEIAYTGNTKQLLVQGRWTARATAFWTEAGMPELVYDPRGGDLDFLHELGGLRSLLVAGGCRDDSAVEHITSLEKLSVLTDCHTQLDLSKLTDLRDLGVTDRVPPEQLAALPLESLFLLEWPYPDLQGLAGSRTLQNLVLKQPLRLASLHVNPAPPVKELQVSAGSAVLNLSSIADLAHHLRVLVLEQVRISHIEAVARLSNLEVFSYEGRSKIADLEFTRGLNRLRRFALFGGARLMTDDLSALEAREPSLEFCHVKVSR